MEKFEKEMADWMKEEQEIPAGVRSRLDETYKEILSDTPIVKRKRGRVTKGLLLAAISMLSLAAVLTFTDVEQALSSFLGFTQFTSEKVQESGFVSKQAATAEEEHTKVSLNEIYNDQNEIGVSLTVDLEADSPLLDESLDNYSFSMAVQDKQNNFIYDLNSGLRENGEAVLSTGTGRLEVSKSEEKHQLNILFKMGNDSGKNVDLNDGKVTVTSISAFEEAGEPGFHTKDELNTADISGKWVLPITNKEFVSFKPVYFKPKDKTYKDAIVAEASPTTLVVKIKNSEIEKIRGTGDPMDVTIIDESKRYPRKEGFETEINGEKIQQYNFGYGGYDSESELTFSLRGNTYILEKE